LGPASHVGSVLSNLVLLNFREAEVGEFELSTHSKNVVGLYVAMPSALLAQVNLDRA